MVDEEVVLKRTRTKLRKVKKGFKTVVKCSGQQHIIYLTPKGHLICAHHPDIDLAANIVMTGFGGEQCKCAEVLKAWRTGDIEALPYVLREIKSLETADLKRAYPAARIVRRHMLKCKYRSRHIKPLPWPDTTDSAVKYLEREFNRYGMTLSITKRSIYANNQTTYIPVYHIKFPGIVDKNSSDSYERRVIIDTINNKIVFGLQNGKGLLRPRPLDKSTVMSAIYAIASLCAVTPLINANNGRSTRAAFYTRLLEIAKKYFPTRVGESGLYLYANSNASDRTVDITLEISTTQGGALPYIINKLRQIMDTVQKHESARYRY